MDKEENDGQEDVFHSVTSSLTVPALQEQIEKIKGWVNSNIDKINATEHWNLSMIIYTDKDHLIITRTELENNELQDFLYKKIRHVKILNAGNV